MEKDDIKLGDIQRILYGDAPPIFLIEVFLRTLLTYMALMFLMRVLGKRINGRATVSEMAVILTLGAIVSVPMQAPDKGLIIGIIGLVCAFIFYRGLNWLSFKSPKLETWVQGQMHILVKDGVIQINALKKTNISTQQLLTVLRSNGTYNLGSVKRLYIEACGLFTIYKFQDKKLGLSTMPPSDLQILEIHQSAHHAKVCTHCGYVEQDQNKSCSNCGSQVWTTAIET